MKRILIFAWFSLILLALVGSPAYAQVDFTTNTPSVEETVEATVAPAETEVVVTVAPLPTDTQMQALIKELADNAKDLSPEFFQSLFNQLLNFIGVLFLPLGLALFASQPPWVRKAATPVSDQAMTTRSEKLRDDYIRVRDNDIVADDWMLPTYLAQLAESEAQRQKFIAEMQKQGVQIEFKPIVVEALG